jgi:uncharacterized protein
MQINVAQQLKQPIGHTSLYQVSEHNEENLPIKGKVQLLRTNRGILVTAKLNTSVNCVCSRCLEEFDYPLTLDIEEEFLPRTVPQDSEGFTIDENHVLDLSEAIHQYILLMRPMKPLCRQDCAGLCPICGQNLNYGSCNCAQQYPHSSGE